MAGENQKSWWTRTLEHVGTTLMCCLAVGAAAIVWNGVTSFDSRLREVQDKYTRQQQELLEQQAAIIQTQSLTVEEVADLKADRERREEEHEELFASLEGHDRALRALLKAIPMSNKPPAPPPLPKAASNDPVNDVRQERRVQKWEDALRDKLKGLR